MKNDLISRQDAIDAVRRSETLDRAFGYGHAVDALRELPSAQPEPSTEIQEILDYLDTTLHPIVSPDNWNVYAELYDMVSKLPSAQAEIVRCKECRHRDPEDHKCDCGHDIIWQLPRDDKWYCADAERRTDG